MEQKNTEICYKKAGEQWMVNEAIKNLFEHNNPVRYANVWCECLKNGCLIFDPSKCTLMLVKISALILLYSKGYCKKKED